MGDIRGFLKTARREGSANTAEQASRCMDCATPFCHWACPLGNYIPEWNDYMFRGNYKAALALLSATNSMPEITGRLCPALCEYACVLGLNDDPVTIRENELALIEYGFANGLIKADNIKKTTGKRIAVVGSGPAGLAAAAQLNKAGHGVVIFEKDKKPGGILRYGIPDFKLEKHIIDRRVDIWKEEGIVFEMGANVGFGCPENRILKQFDAVLLAIGSRVPRDLKIKGRELKGIYFAMDYLIQANKKAAGEKIPKDEIISAKGRKAVVIGGGDTGADCAGTALMDGALSVAQIEIMPKPPICRPERCPWPNYPALLKTPAEAGEKCSRKWQVLTKEFVGEKGCVSKLSCAKAEFKEKGKGRVIIAELAGSGFEIESDMVIIAAGFLHPEPSGLLQGLNLNLDDRGNAKTDENYMTSAGKVFSAGDMRRGQSLVVWAVSEGRRAAHCIDKYLMGTSRLPVM